MKYMTYTETELITKARQLDVDALTEIYDEISPGIYRYAYRLLGDQNLAEDCVSETFSRFLNKLSEKKGPNQYLRAYLYRIAHNWITDYYRRPLPEESGLPEVLPSPANSPEELTSVHLENERIRKHILTLPALQQQVILLKFLEEWDNKEIAKSINKSVGAVKAIQNRGFKKLKSLLEEENEKRYEYHSVTNEELG
ncbi:MAG: hypothetical protein CL609_16205 [Anaerolineaceae bacterium]|nr:hypothetical protein [Anaerolineaceae bacterium]